MKNDIFKSVDAGASWATASPRVLVHALALHPTDPSTVYVGTNSGVYKTTDGGAAWNLASTGLTSTDVYSLAIDPTNPAVLYAGTESGLFKSSNGGASWLGNAPFPPYVIAGLPRIPLTCLAIDPTAPTTLYAGTWGEGVFKSTDGGMNWTAANAGITQWDIFAIAVSPATPALILAGGWGGGVFKSTNAAVSWTSASTGISGRSISGLSLDPFMPHTIFAGGWSEGVWSSSDAGANWSETSAGLSSSAVYALTADPDAPGVLYVGTLKGVFRSMNGGVNWLGVGLAGTEVRALLVVPGNPRTLYAGAPGNGVYRSTDGGSSWTAANAGLTNLGVFALAGDPSTPNTLYAGTGGGVFKSANGGASWTLVSPVASVSSLVLTPGSPPVLYAGTWSGGVIRSADEGVSWGVVSPAIDVTALAGDPGNPNILFAGTLSGVFKTTDGGASWTEINAGLTSPQVISLALDPVNPATLYAGTNYGGTYRLRQAAADPQLFLDVSRGELRTEEVHSLRVTLLPGERAAAANVFLAIQLPDGSLLYLRPDGSLSPDSHPVASVSPILPYSGQPYVYTFGGTEPAGTYRWLGAYADPATGALLGPVAEMAFTFYPVTSGASLAVGLNGGFLRPGDLHTMRLTLVPGASPTADVFVALQLPDHSLLFLQEDGSLAATPAPVQPGWNFATGTGLVAFTHLFTGAEPPGTYRWLAGFATPGTLDFLGPIVSAPFRFDP